MDGFEPTTPCLQGRCSPTELHPRSVHAVPSWRHILIEWWAWEDLNFRPHAYQACALTT